ncbi:MAG: hypothetical protein KME55_31750 [Nostoc indistinguendum CM1-VF10]|jgi:hypothetical protein|nr:hypothetical protein [Nostoc indistinguendum CM1-VF10]
MKPTQVFNQFFLTIFVRLHSLQYNVQEWISKEIVDDDPYDQETFFPKNQKVSQPALTAPVVAVNAPSYKSNALESPELEGEAADSIRPASIVQGQASSQ